jgi:hypothetical protein
MFSWNLYQSLLLGAITLGLAAKGCEPLGPPPSALPGNPKVQAVAKFVRLAHSPSILTLDAHTF